MLYDNSEKQNELFDEFKTEEKGFKIFKGFARQPKGRIFIFQLSVEKIAFLFIGVILILVVSFCLGVDRGKRIINIAKPIMITVKTKPAPVTNITTKTPLASRKGIIYTVRIASYVNKKSAADETAKLRQLGFPAYVKTSGKYYIICVGDYMDRKQADAVLPALRNKYGNNIFIKTTKNK